MMVFDRRTICGIILVALSTGSRANAQSANAYTVRIRSFEDAFNAALPLGEQKGLTITADDSETAKELVARTPAGRAAPVVLIIVGAIAAINISKLLIQLVRATYYGGVVIDARGNTIQISNDVKIPAGLVIVLARDGTKATFKESDITTDLVNAVLSKSK
ncbi:hypothetical protein [Bradyrhizobium yuanmingense]|uniref:hypothetical protein n=1 Tax=Bradyrhizobium yuanmingense TaxID=108015 RepID=UPI0023B8E2F6|nr:hypothetical protein [Bradyrhizobium yuanmingense]MDF0584171.1 hypothetical protein [Bradyrhizobium yuanmingense]